MKPCRCGRAIYGLGKRCRTCQAEFKAERITDEPKFPKPPRGIQEGRSPDHLAWIRTLPCAVPGCIEKSQAAHVRQGTGGGMGMKPDDRWTLPLCGALHHPEQHRIGHRAFDLKYDIDSRGIAASLWEQAYKDIPL